MKNIIKLISSVYNILYHKTKQVTKKSIHKKKGRKAPFSKNSLETILRALK